MKKSYIKLIIFIFIVVLLLFANSFSLKIFNKMYLSFFIIFLLIIFKLLFGFEKDRHRYIKEIIFQMLIFLLCFFLIYYLIGIFIGFTVTKNYFTIYGLKQFFIPTILYIIFKEILRYMILSKSSESKMLIILSTIFFIILDNTIALSVVSFNTTSETFLFIALSFLPTVSQNIMCTCLSIRYGYKPNIVYLLIMNLYIYIIPIVPNPNEYLYSIINFLLPIYMLFSIKYYVSKYSDEELTRNYNKKSNYLLIIPTIMIIILVYLTSGHFKYYSIAIASGSMEPTIYKGDVVISRRVDSLTEVKLGDILAYRKGENIIVHRINKIIYDEKKQMIIYTKGDNNSNVDSYKVTTDMIIGIIKSKIPYIGWPTVLFSELK